MKPSVTLKEIPEESVRAAFLRRPDIMALPAVKQQELWEAHRVNLHELLARLERLRLEGFVLP